MDKTDHRRLRLLIERFDAGQTDNAEEREIHEAYARSRRLPDDLERLRPLFGWYASLEDKASVKRSGPRMLWLRVAASAAVVAALITLGAGLLGQHSNLPDLESGYVIRNGVKYTDMAQIKSAMTEAMRLADASRRAAAEDMRSHMPEKAREVVASYIDMDDPAARAVIDRVLPEK